MKHVLVRAAFCVVAGVVAATSVGESLSFMGAAFFPSKDEEKISVICKSDAPWIVIDFFSAKDPDHGQRHAFHHSDIDGDRIDDVHHGDLVEALLKVSGKKVISYGLAGTERDVSELVEEDDLTGKIADIIERIKTGGIPPRSPDPFIALVCHAG